jgi:hypothetical protein
MTHLLQAGLREAKLGMGVKASAECEHILDPSGCPSLGAPCVLGCGNCKPLLDMSLAGEVTSLEMSPG